MFFKLYETPIAMEGAFGEKCQGKSGLEYSSATVEETLVTQ